MTKGIELEIGGMQFQSRIAAANFCQAILKRYAIGEMIQGDDDLFLRALIARHPRSQFKIGLGIKHFEVRLRNHGVTCFHSVREDGSVEEFSYKQCLS